MIAFSFVIEARLLTSLLRCAVRRTRLPELPLTILRAHADLHRDNRSN